MFAVCCVLFVDVVCYGVLFRFSKKVFVAVVWCLLFVVCCCVLVGVVCRCLSRVLCVVVLCGCC